MRLPGGAVFILDRLTQAGFQAYIVGGCVRDSLLGKEPKDWDVCTSATPDEMLRVFRGCHVVETGLKHGTLTVVVEHVPYEVTTFRVDGEYTDHRHPDQVVFVTDVREDLARRDFTVNAMAYHPDTDVVDAFCGREDLAAGVIRCVGDAVTRFEEDALRILRALRFASVYGFSIEKDTAHAIHALKHTLKDVAAERIRVELGKLICGGGAGAILMAYADVLLTVLPRLQPKQEDWAHAVKVVSGVPAVESVRWAALLSGSGYAAHAAGPVLSVMNDLKMDHATRDRVVLLCVHHHDVMTADTPVLRRKLHELGEEALRQLLLMQRADGIAKNPDNVMEVNARFDGVEAALEVLLATDPCVTLKQMAVGGGDLMAAGFPKGKAIGVCLNQLLMDVLDEKLPNDREALLAQAIRMKETLV